MSIVNKISEYFEFDKHKTNLRTEILAGLSTFLALSYIFVVNPSILGEAGMNKSMVLFATIIVSALATLAMGIWAKKPFVLAPGMEMNAYVAFFVIGALGFAWQDALGAVFWSGILFMVLTLTNIREKIIKAIPDKMKSGLSLSVGMFLMLIALKLAGVLAYDGIDIQGIGILSSSMAYVLYFGIALVLVLQRFKIKGAVLVSIILSTVLAHLLGLGGVAAEQVEISGDMLSGIMQFNPAIILDPRIFSVILILFLVDFYGSVAKFIGLTRNTSIVDKDGRMPQMKEALSVDGVATVAGAGLGTTSLTTYVESGVGIGEGGRTGLVAVVCGLLMLSIFVLTPLVNLVPVIATTGALFWVGIMLFPSKEELKKYKAIDIVTILVMVVGVIWTFSLDRAMLFGFLVFIAGSLLTGRTKEIDKYTVISTVLLLIGAYLSL
jgi:AGZA family xanthine/uracil permease-like MFS transporter